MIVKLFEGTKYHVGRVTLSALKNAADLLEESRTLFTTGAQNQKFTMLGSEGMSYVMWKVSKDLETTCKNQIKGGLRKYHNHLVSCIAKGVGRKLPKKELIDDHVTGVLMAMCSGGGNCMENAELMAYLIIKNGGLGGGYDVVKRMYLDGSDHEIVVVEHTAGEQRLFPDIMIDAWVPATQACLVRDSYWGAREPYSWAVNVNLLSKKLYDKSKTAYDALCTEREKSGKKNRIGYDQWVDARTGTKSKGYEVFFDKVSAEVDRARKSMAGKTEALFRKYKFGKGCHVAVHFYCNAEGCNSEWSKPALEFDYREKGEARNRYCPLCEAGPMSYKILEKQRYYKPPFQEPEDRWKVVEKLNEDKDENYKRKAYEKIIDREWEINIKPGNYANTGIIDLPDESDDLYYIIYSRRKGYETGSDNRKFWIKHFKKMRTYQWGEVFEQEAKNANL